jgi:AraC family transcriptional regulator, transcriptional activator of pobA
MELQTLNIEQLRCNTFADNGQQFDMCRLEDFFQEAVIGEHVHRHNYYMLMLVNSGLGRQLIDFDSYEAKAGQIYLMYPGQVHAWEQSRKLRGYLIFFTSAFFTERYNNNNLLEFPFFNSSYYLPYIDVNKPAFVHLNNLLACMLREYEGKPQDYLKTLRSYLNIFLYECKRLYQYREEAQQQAADKNTVLIVRQFEQMIEAHFREKRMVKDYAELLLLTPNYLNAVCNKVVGKSAGTLIRQRIMLEAKRLLLHDSRTVAEIGHLLHFDDSSYFSRFFKKYEGCSPEQFRKKYKNC